MAIPVAQAFGARDYRSVRRYVYNSLYLATALSLLLAAASGLLCRSIVGWIKVPADIRDSAYAYLLTLLLGIPCTFFYNLLASIIRALGDSRTPFRFLMFSTFLNIALDILFIGVMRWGVVSAGIATVLSQGISAALCGRYMLSHYDILKAEGDERRFDAPTARRLLSIGAPMGLQFSITAIGSIMIQSANNALGTTCVAAFAAGMRIKMFFMCPLESLGMAMTTFAGQNLGAGKVGRIIEGVKASLLMIAVYCVACLAFMWPCARALARIFVSAADTEMLASAVLYIRVAVAFYCLLGTLCLFRYTIQGLGYTNFAMWSGVMEMVARVAVAVWLVGPFGFRAVCFNDGIAWIAANLFLVPAFIHVYRLKSREVAAQIG